MKHQSKFTLLSLLVIISLACEIFGVPVLEVTQNANGDSGKVDIVAKKGGRVSFDNHISVEIASNGVSSNTSLTIQKIKQVYMHKDELDILIPIGDIYDINIGDAKLSKRAVIEYTYDPNNLPQNVSPENLFLAYLDEDTKQWVFAGGDVNTRKNVVRLETTHFSEWGIFTWNWWAWNAIVHKVAKHTLGDFLDLIDLSAVCPQSGNYVQVQPFEKENLIRGCVDKDDPSHASLRLVNPRSFFYEIKPISGGNGYPKKTMLSPGDSITFKANLKDPSPLIISAEITHEAGRRLIVYLILSIMPGMYDLSSNTEALYCLAETSFTNNDINVAATSLLGNQLDKTAESLGHFLADTKSVEKFIIATSDCGFKISKSWSVPGISKIADVIAVDVSLFDFFVTHLAQRTQYQIEFYWTTANTPTNPTSTQSQVQPPSIPSKTPEPNLISLQGSKIVYEEPWGDDVTAIKPDGSGKTILYKNDNGSGWATCAQYKPICIITSQDEGVQIFNLETGEHKNWQDCGWKCSDTTIIISPDGEKIIAYGGKFPETNVIYLANIDGTNPKKIIEFAENILFGSVVWSSDSEKIAYTTSESIPNQDPNLRPNIVSYSGPPSLNIVNIDGSNRQTLYTKKEIKPSDGNPPDYGIFTTTWSPDGEQLAFDTTDGEIYKANLNGSQLTLISKYGYFPSWSPDGTRIIYFSCEFWNDPDPLKRIECAFISDLFSMKPDGSDVIQLTKEPDSNHGLYGYAVDPVWSPDGNWIAFISSRGWEKGCPALDNGHGFCLDIYVMRADGTNLTKITNAPESKNIVGWLP